MNDCFICNKHTGNTEASGIMIYEDEFIYVGHIDSNGRPNYLGHIMIDLKRHVPTLAEMTSEEASAFGVMMARMSKALKDTENAEHIYSLVSGDHVPHLHMHLVARYPNTPKAYWGPLEVYGWEEAPVGDNNEVIALCNRLKTFLKETAYE